MGEDMQPERAKSARPAVSMNPMVAEFVSKNKCESTKETPKPMAPGSEGDSSRALMVVQSPTQTLDPSSEMSVAKYVALESSPGWTDKTPEERLKLNPNSRFKDRLDIYSHQPASCSKECYYFVEMLSNALFSTDDGNKKLNEELNKSAMNLLAIQRVNESKKQREFEPETSVEQHQTTTQGLRNQVNYFQPHFGHIKEGFEQGYKQEIEQKNKRLKQKNKELKQKNKEIERKNQEIAIMKKEYWKEIHNEKVKLENSQRDSIKENKKSRETSGFLGREVRKFIGDNPEKEEGFNARKKEFDIYLENKYEHQPKEKIEPKLQELADLQLKIEALTTDLRNIRSTLSESQNTIEKEHGRRDEVAANAQVEELTTKLKQAEETIKKERKKAEEVTRALQPTVNQLTGKVSKNNVEIEMLQEEKKVHNENFAKVKTNLNAIKELTAGQELHMNSLGQQLEQAHNKELPSETAVAGPSTTFNAGPSTESKSKKRKYNKKENTLATAESSQSSTPMKNAATEQGQKLATNQETELDTTPVTQAMEALNRYAIKFWLIESIVALTLIVVIAKWI
ncbi:hypothetical protein EG329_009922 [Mollisiaceae sp. DMI_Dod_QoI]|nr:hypothetical protein EG329_009922 [Helotiales sp. DMI_Dod_QoI]